MATARKCDRCGNYYDKNTKYNSASPYTGYVCGLFTLKSRGFDCEKETYLQYDLCDECLESFYNWLWGWGCENAADD